MKLKSIFSITTGASLLLLASCRKDSVPGNLADDSEILGSSFRAAGKFKPQVFKSNGDKATVEQGLAAFRNAIGGSLNLAPGAVGGRREINWDNVPDELTNADGFPGNYFSAVGASFPNERKLGAQLFPVLSFGYDFRVSDNNFSDMDPSYASEFPSFSTGKAFIPVYNNVADVYFKVPGTNTRAYVESFGIVFIDVDRNHAATLEFFDEQDNRIGAFRATASRMGGKFSFLGVRMPGKQIYKVRINSGTGVLAQGYPDISQGGEYDLVTIDDIIYNEPKAIN